MAMEEEAAAVLSSKDPHCFLVYEVTSYTFLTVVILYGNLQQVLTRHLGSRKYWLVSYVNKEINCENGKDDIKR